MKLSQFLPFENYVITTNLSVEEVVERLSFNVEPEKMFTLTFLRSSSMPYEGNFDGNSFKISRIISYKNSFLPVILGEFKSFDGKTEIKIKMRMVIFVMIFMSFWLGMVSLFCVGITIVGISQLKSIFQNGFSPFFLIPYVMFTFGYLMTYLAFKYESKKSKQFLAELFEAE